MKTVLFNIQFAYRERGNAGSAVRPARMRAAFEAAGYRVVEISGHRKERAKQVDQVVLELPTLNPATTLLYAESATYPHVFDLPTKRPGPSPDLKLARAAKEHGISTGLFYRDMHWRYIPPQGARSTLIHQLYRPFFKSELKAYAATYDVLFAPTLGLLNAAPETKNARKLALPPGGPEAAHESGSQRNLRLVHVGGLTGAKGIYDVLPLVQGVGATPWGLDLICRQPEWQLAQEHYLPLPDDAEVLNLEGAAKDTQLQQATLGALVYTPDAYRELAFPFKMLEYLGAGLPIVASGPSEAARFVTENGVGWEVAPTAEALQALLVRLHDHPEEIEATRARIPGVLQQNTWQHRIAQIENALWA